MPLMCTTLGTNTAIMVVKTVLQYHSTCSLEYKQVKIVFYLYYNITQGPQALREGSFNMTMGGGGGGLLQCLHTQREETLKKLLG